MIMLLYLHLHDYVITFTLYNLLNISPYRNDVWNIAPDSKQDSYTHSLCRINKTTKLKSS